MGSPGPEADAFPLHPPLLVWDVADPWIALGAILILIPIILYLLERRRTQVVDWPALRFFLADLKRRIRWMQLKELLLIALRCSIIAGVVAALMRPGETYVRSVRERAAGTRGAVILLDNSYSMAARGSEGRGPSLWDEARARAVEIIGDLSPGDMVQVATVAGKPAALTPLPIRNLEDAKAAVREAALGGGSVSILGGLDLAAYLARVLPVPSREIYLITDLQERGWALRDEVRWSFVLGRLSSLSPSPSLAVVDVGLEKVPNRAVLSLETSRPIVGTDRAVEIAARIGQYGDPSPRSVDAVLRIDGEERESRAVQVAEEAPATVRFRHRFGAPGAHRVDVGLRASADSLPEDDVRYMALEVLDRLPVLIVAGAMASGSRSFGDGDLLDLALAPRARGSPVPEVLFRPSVIGAQAFGELRFADIRAYRAVILSDVPALDPGPARLLEEYVRSGGGLLIFCGEKASAASYNQDLFREGRGILPAKLLKLEGDAAAAEGLFSPSRLVEGHPALEAFGDVLRSELSKVRIRRWWRTEPPPPGTAAIADVEPGAPYLLEKSLGRGKVIFVSTSARLEDSDLPKKPIFLPLIHGLLFYIAAAAEDRRNIPLGAEIVQPLEGTEPGWTAVVEDPLHVSHAVSIAEVPDPTGSGGSRSVARYGPASIPGFYMVKVKTGSGERVFAHAAEIDPEESDLRRLVLDELERIRGALGMRIVRDLRDLRPEETGGEARREWWRPILLGALALILLEVLATRALAKGRAPWQPPPPRES